MDKTGIDRRTLLTATTALSAASLLSGRAFAQGSAGPSATLPARGEFVVRGAHVLSMDDTIGDLPSGDVHVRDGAIVAVAASSIVRRIAIQISMGRSLMAGKQLLSKVYPYLSMMARASAPGKAGR